MTIDFGLMRKQVFFLEFFNELSWIFFALELSIEKYVLLYSENVRLETSLAKKDNEKSQSFKENFLISFMEQDFVNHQSSSSS